MLVNYIFPIISQIHLSSRRSWWHFAWFPLEKMLRKFGLSVFRLSPCRRRSLFFGNPNRNCWRKFCPWVGSGAISTQVCLRMVLAKFVRTIRKPNSHPNRFNRITKQSNTKMYVWNCGNALNSSRWCTLFKLYPYMSVSCALLLTNCLHYCIPICNT